MTKTTKTLLASIASAGILGHNTAVSMPKEFSFETIQRLLPHPWAAEALACDLDTLTTQGLLYKRNTGRYGYGDFWEEGADVWKITAKGLCYLWLEA